MENPSNSTGDRPTILLMGQTPPPWHGQAVATQILFDHDWPDFEVHRLRMEFSEEMLEVGRFQWKKLRHLFHLVRRARQILKSHPGCILFYPPASAKWIPFLRDLVFLPFVRPLAGASVFIFHASGLPEFVSGGWLRSVLGRLAYQNADMALEVAQEEISPHAVFQARSWVWCPCAIEVPDLTRPVRSTGAPMQVLFVGSLQEGKGVLQLLETAAILKDKGRQLDFHFRIVGKWFSDEFEREARDLRAELGLENMVEFAGQLTGRDKWDAYASADVFFFPTHYASEATPIVIMEALGAGLPVITTQWAGIPAMLQGCESARLFPIRSPEQYASALLELSTDTIDLHALSGVSKAYYRERFLPAKFIERVADAFRLVSPASDVRNPVALPEKTHGPRDSNDRAPDATRETHRPPPGNGNRAEYESTATTVSGGASGPLTDPFRITVYLADQNPGYDRSFGISRMSQVVLSALRDTGKVWISTITSKTSQQAPENMGNSQILPWGTRRKSVRLLTDHLHPLLVRDRRQTELFYYPKGYLPLLDFLCRPSVVTIHDTIIQYDEDHYPNWRKQREYSYWATALKHTLRNADCVLTVSKSSKQHILQFMDRHGIPRKKIHVTYEPCAYEPIPQPVSPGKKHSVIHLASREPHKRTAHLVRWWLEAERNGMELPVLHLIGNPPDEVLPLLTDTRTLVSSPFLTDEALQAVYTSARALIFPSEIEGFGLPALEAYYLGTPVCFVKGTSVEEILSVATSKGGFSLDDPASLFHALDEVAAMSPDEIRRCGLKLREIYASSKVAERMLQVFEEVVSKSDSITPASTRD